MAFLFKKKLKISESKSREVLDRIDQVLAQLSLVRVTNQFPIRLYLENIGTTIQNAALDRIQQVEHRDYKKRIDDATKLVEKLSGDQTLVGRIRDISQNLPPVDKLVGLAESSQSGKIFSIGEPLSVESVQGQLYDIDVFPNATLHRGKVVDTESRLEKPIMAIMKQTPVYAPELVQEYTEVVKETTEEAKEKKRDIEYIFDREYRNIQNPAYVDALGYYLGSLLVEYGMSSFFPLFYASFLAQDVKEERRLGIPCPTELVIMQPLNGTFNTLMEKGFFYDRRASSLQKLNPTKVMSMFAQIVFGLATAQDVFALVNNDFHPGNLMYEEVDPYTVLYYRIANGDIYLAVPTYGKVYKMIDFGKASFVIGDFRIVSRYQSSPDVDPNNKSADLYTVATMVARALGLSEIVAGTENAPVHLRHLTAMLKTILDCEDGRNVFTIYRQDPTPVPVMDKFQKFASERGIDLQRLDKRNYDSLLNTFVYRVWPTLKGTPCTSAIPDRNLTWFVNEFSIKKKDIPKNAVVYRIPFHA
jgi:hypothetical protein